MADITCGPKAHILKQRMEALRERLPRQFKRQTSFDETNVHGNRIRQKRCNWCGVKPIVGWRYKCLLCFRFDLCEMCYLKGAHGDTGHEFKVKSDHRGQWMAVPEDLRATHKNSKPEEEWQPTRPLSPTSPERVLSDGEVNAAIHRPTTQEMVDAAQAARKPSAAQEVEITMVRRFSANG
eukprot:tig00001098_g7065.t1